mmetsp:Transcript_2095/g.5040  ORF Transcript_2095/g.5040 Transcript_2095/m.5040 type:complete len:208 (-) Transcript_2095:97-720(-)
MNKATQHTKKALTNFGSEKTERGVQTSMAACSFSNATTSATRALSTNSCSSPPMPSKECSEQLPSSLGNANGTEHAPWQRCSRNILGFNGTVTPTVGGRRAAFRNFPSWNASCTRRDTVAAKSRTSTSNTSQHLLPAGVQANADTLARILKAPVPGKTTPAVGSRKSASIMPLLCNGAGRASVQEGSLITSLAVLPASRNRMGAAPY